MHVDREGDNFDIFGFVLGQRMENKALSLFERRNTKGGWGNVCVGMDQYSCLKGEKNTKRRCLFRA